MLKSLPKSEWTDDLLMGEVRRWCLSHGKRGRYKCQWGASFEDMFLVPSGRYSSSMGQGDFLHYSSHSREYMLDVGALWSVFSNANKVDDTFEDGDSIYVDSRAIEHVHVYNADVKSSRGPDYDRPWSKEEDEVIQEMYPLYGPSVRRWDKRLEERTVPQIVERARELSLSFRTSRKRSDKQRRMSHDKARLSNTSGKRRKSVRRSEKTTEKSVKATDEHVPSRVESHKSGEDYKSKYAVYDHDGTPLGWYTWEDVLLKFSQEARIKEGKTSALGAAWNHPPRSSNAVVLTTAIRS